MSRPRMSPSDELRYCRNALADALAERDALAATVERVRALIDTAPWTVDTAELRAALAAESSP